MNVGIGQGRTVSFLGIHKSDFWYSVVRKIRVMLRIIKEFVKRGQGYFENKQAFSEGNQCFDDTIQRAVDDNQG